MAGWLWWPERNGMQRMRFTCSVSFALCLKVMVKVKVIRSKAWTALRLAWLPTAEAGTPPDL